VGECERRVGGCGRGGGGGEEGRGEECGEWKAIGEVVNKARKGKMAVAAMGGPVGNVET